MTGVSATLVGFLANQSVSRAQRRVGSRVTATAGGDYDVIVDAGNATVLDTHVEGGHGGGGGGFASARTA